jgi:hypothetical protein
VSELPRPGDRVRITYEAEYRNGWEAVGKDGTVTYPADAVVEVVEPADDPSKSLVGEVRKYHDGTPVALTADDGDWPWSGFGQTFTGRGHKEMEGCPVIGAVPGTPAAEQDGSELLRQLTQGQRRIGETDAAYRERVVGAGLAHVADNNVVHLGLVEECDGCCPQPEEPMPSPHGWEPRVFQADGPEPPEDVTVLRWLDRDPGARWEYLVHTPSGWVWTSGPDQKPHAPATGAYWDTATRACPGRYREVQP